MRRHFFSRTLVAAAGLLAAMAGHAAVAADAVPTERLLPPNVYLYVTVPDVQEFKARWDQTIYGQLKDDPNLAEFWREISERYEEFSKTVETRTGATLEELLNVPSGQLSAAMVQPPGKAPGFAFFLDYGENEATLDKLLSKAAEALKEQGAERKTAEFEDTEIVVYTMPQKEADEEAAVPAKKPQQVAYFTRDSRLVVAGDPAILEAVLVRWDGKHPQTFADNEVYQYIIEKTKTDGHDAAISWYLNPIGLVRSVVATQGQGNLQAQMLLGFLPALGLSELKAIGGSVDLAAGEFDSVNRAFAYIEYPTSGVLNIFQFPAVEQSPPKWVTADVNSFFSANWNVTGAYAAIETLVDSFRGPGAFATMVDQVAASDNGPNLHPKKDFIDLLNGQIDVVTKAPAAQKAAEGEQAAEAMPRPDRYVVALGLKDPAKMKAVLGKIAKTPNFPGKTREFRGETIYELSTAGALQQTAETMGAAVANNALMLSSDVALLEQVLRDDGDRRLLADLPEYRRIAEHFPAKTSLISFQRQDSQVKTAYEALRSGQAADVLEGIDFTKLPPFEAIEKYLPPTGSYAAPENRGVHFVSFSLKPKQ